MSIDMSQFLQTFFEESFEGLDEMETRLLGLTPGDADAETLNTIFRAAHSIKGGAGTFGLKSVAELTHHLETLLDRLRQGNQALGSEEIQASLEAVDALRSLLTAERDGGSTDANQAESITQRLAELVGVEPAPSQACDGQSPDEPSGANDATGWRIEFRPHPQLFMSGNDPLRLIEELAELGELDAKCHTRALPPLSELDPEESFLSWTLQLKGPVAREAVEEVFEWVEDDCDLSIEPLAETVTEPAAGESPITKSTEGPQKPAETQQPTGNTGSTATASSSLRVDTGKIDTLIDMVGELVITQSMLNELGEDFTEDKLEQLQDGLAQLERNTRELQENVMRIRMVPISYAYARLPRMVHDLSNQLGKQVDLRLLGEQTELDKTVMEKIVDPLVHLVRNSMDHGIEPPEQRREKGKPETGVLELNAYHKGGYIVIEINDDGAGISREKLLRKARASGLLDETAEPPDEQVFDLIFHPGLSTAEQTTDVSGRGVGMDVVKRNIRALGGNITVHSQAEAGTRITIFLPLTLSILDGQLFRVGDQVYIIPLIAIIESVQMQSEKISSMADRAELYHWREGYIPVLRLSELFNEPRAGSLDNELMVVVEEDDRYLGLQVDELMGQQQVVIKSLKSNYRPVTGFAGATILGDGTVALILDIAGIMELAQQNNTLEQVASTRLTPNHGVEY